MEFKSRIYWVQKQVVNLNIWELLKNSIDIYIYIMNSDLIIPVLYDNYSNAFTK
jgi:hypothetical protein